MAVHGGELMVIIRAQDYASRTIHKVSGELAGMQRIQRMQMRAQKQYLPALRKEQQLLNSLALANRNYAQGLAKSSAQNFNMGRSGRVLWTNLKEARKALADFQTTAGKIPQATRDMINAAGGVDKFATALRKVELERLHRIGAVMSGIGRTMQLFGAVGTLALGLAANSFAKFSQSAATAGTQMRDLNAPLAQAAARSKVLQEAILDMAMIFPNSAQDMTDAAYEIFSSMNLMHNGVMDVQSGLKLLATANKAAVAGQVDLSEATNAMIVALNIFDPKLHDVTGTMNEVFDIVRFGKIHLDDLSHVFTQFASAAHAAGMSLKDIGAAFATLTLFQDPGKASAGLGRLIELLRTPQFKEGLKNLVDVDITDVNTGKMRPLLAIMKEIVKQRPELAASRKAAIDFFIELTKASGKTKVGVQGTVQARRAFETFATHMDTFAETVAHVRGNYDEMNKAFQSRMTDPGVQWELFLNRMKALAIVIGQQVIPVFNQLGRWIGGLIQWFQRMKGGTSGVIIQLAAWAAIGTLVAGVILSMTGGISQLIVSMLLLRAATIAAGEGFSIMRTLMIASGIGLIIVGSSIAAVAVMTHWDQVRAYFHAWWDDIGAGFTNFWDEQKIKAKGAAGGIMFLLGKAMPFSDVGDAMQKQGAKMWHDADYQLKHRSSKFLKNYNKWLKIYAKQHPDKGMDWLKDWKKITGNFDNSMLSDEYKKYLATLNKATGTAASTAKDHAQAVKQAMDNMNQTVKTATTNLVNTYEQLQAANQTALGGLFQGPTMQGILGGVFKNINDSLRQFGVQIPVPFAILKQDLDQSLMYFKRWRQDINKLIKRGVPYEMIQELQAMGPEGIPILEGLLGGSKGQIRGVIRAYKQGQKLTDKATKEDMNRKLAFWNKFGKDAAWQMVMGIISNPRNAKIAKMYEDYVKNTYGAILQKTFQDDVAEYMANALAMAKAQAANANIMPFTGNMFAPTPKKGSRAELAGMTPKQLTAAYRKNAWNLTVATSLLGPLTPEEKRRVANLRNRRQAILAEYRRDAAPAVRRQIAAQSRQHRQVYTITYEGDTVHIKADGATVASVTRALQKRHFTQKHKHKKGTAASPNPTLGGGHP